VDPGSAPTRRRTTGAWHPFVDDVEGDAGVDVEAQVEALGAVPGGGHGEEARDDLREEAVVPHASLQVFEGGFHGFDGGGRPSVPEVRKQDDGSIRHHTSRRRQQDPHPTPVRRQTNSRDLNIPTHPEQLGERLPDGVDVTGQSVAQLDQMLAEQCSRGPPDHHVHHA